MGIRARMQSPFFSVVLNVEYLPSQHIVGVPISINFQDREAAEKSYKYIQKRHPTARLVCVESI